MPSFFPVAAISLFATDILGVYTILAVAVAVAGGYAVLEHRRLAATTAKATTTKPSASPAL